MKHLFTKLFATLLVCCLFSNVSQAQWRVLGAQSTETPVLPLGMTPAAAEHLSLAVSAAGVPYIAFVDPANEHKVAVMRCTETTGWANVGAPGISAGAAGTTSLTIAPDGTPYLFFKDMRATNLNMGSVMRFDGTNWVAVGNQASLSAGTIEWPVIITNAAGVPHIAFRETTITNNPGTIRRFDSESGEWVNLGAPALAQAGVSPHSIFFDTEGRLHWGGQDWARSSVFRYSGEGTAWTKVGTGNTTGGARAAVATIDQVNNIPYLLYRESGAGSLNNNLSVFKYTGTGTAGGWETVGPTQFSGGGVDFANIVIDNTGTPVVAYEESATTKTVIRKYNSTANTWDYIASPWGDALSQGLANFTSMAKDAQGNIYVAFSDAGVEGKAVVLQYTPSTTTSSAREIARRTGIEVYPNPSASDFRFTAAGKFSYTVFNNAGQVMEHGQGIGEGKVGSGLRAGLYYIQLQTEAGNQTLKLLKQ